MADVQFIGGSFAPPLSDTQIADYKTFIASLKPGPVKDAMALLLSCCEKWWELPEPVGTPTSPHPSGRGTVVLLQNDHKEVLEPLIPWKHELEGIQKLFDTLPTGITDEVFDAEKGKRVNVIGDPEAKKLRDVAFHLLWHVIELERDREPLTKDKL